MSRMPGNAPFRRLSRGVLVACALVLVGALPVLAAQEITIRALVQDPDQYDGKVVTAVGTIRVYRERVSSAGNPYTLFRLTDEGVSVSVFLWDKHGLRNGQKVRVTGTFTKAKHVRANTFDNEIQAHRVDVLQ
jgi:hypothetical protein